MIEYGEALARQRARLSHLISGSVGDTLCLCQHPAVISAGTSARDSSLISSKETLQSEKIAHFYVERGGDLTYHGPGQLVAYPILNLHRYRTDIGWYMRTLEQIIIDTLEMFKVHAHRYEGRAGVWVTKERKIASMGVKLSRWCTMHGVAINLTRESEVGFSHIVPCGLEGVMATSIETESGISPDQERFKESFIRIFLEQFNTHSPQ